jgi:hypothetical protein
MHAGLDDGAAAGFFLHDRLVRRPGAFAHKLGVETVTAARQGLDIGPAVGTVPQTLAEQRDVLGQAALFNKDVRPDFPEQSVLVDDRSPVLHKHGQQVEGLRRQRDDLAVLKQEAVLQIDSKRIEFHRSLPFAFHAAVRT